MFLGIDLGTSGVKAILLDDDQTIVAEAQSALTVMRKQDGWSEQMPADWLQATETAIGALRHQADLSGVKGLGLAGQMHGAVLLDEADEVLRPCILWNDTRAYAEAAAMDSQPGRREITGNITFAGFTAPKLAWVAVHEPVIAARVRRILLPKDYLRLWLTGDAVGEMSDASGTAWFDPALRDWSDDLLARQGLSRAAMPRLVEGSAAAGRLRPSIAQRLGLPVGTVLAGGAGDNAAAGIGVGAVTAGAGFVSLGTSGVLFVATDTHRPAPAQGVHAFCHALPETWHQMGVVLAATDALNWLARLTGQDSATLTSGLGALAAPGRPMFLPYLGGERTPHNDASIRGAFLGLDHATDAVAASRAVLEGVAFALADCRDAIAATGTTLQSLVAVGGGSRSDYWLSLLATILGVPVDRPAAGDFGAAFGAARLAMLATGADAVALCQRPAIARRFDPVAELAPAFNDAHARFRSAYPALKGLT